MSGRFRVAKQNHVCSWCGGIIKPYSRFYCDFLTLDKRYKIKLHEDCHEIFYHFNSPSNWQLITQDDISLLEAEQAYEKIKGY